MTIATSESLIINKINKYAIELTGYIQVDLYKLYYRHNSRHNLGTT